MRDWRAGALYTLAHALLFLLPLLALWYWGRF